MQLQRTAGLHVHLDVIGIDLVQRVVDAGVVDLAGAELIDNAIARWSGRGHRFVAIGRHAAVAVLPLIAVEGDDALAGAIDRALIRIRARAPRPGNRIAVGQRRRGERADQHGGQNRLAHRVKSGTPAPKFKRK
jgi:hypothetical protein